jgi:hypothetical protein
VVVVHIVLSGGRGAAKPGSVVPVLGAAVPVLGVAVPVPPEPEHIPITVGLQTKL